jgi:phosphonate transport system substrate-binding protein
MLILCLCVIVALGYVGKLFFEYRTAVADRSAMDAWTVQNLGLVKPAGKHLAASFSDTHSRLLADPPAAADQLLDPPTIVLGHWESADPESVDIPWDQFEKHLSEATGRKVEDLKFDDSPAQIEQIRNGHITLVALHAADAPFLVNNCGYQPVAVMAEVGSGAIGNHLDIIVPAQSPISRPADLHGHTLTCVLPTSVTGYRAAISLLAQNENLRPDVDYFITWSLKQKASIVGVAHGQLESAAISDDKLQTLLKSGDVHTSEYRVIYQSEVIPRMTIGWFYNLKPELAEKIRQAILSFHPTPAPGDATSDDAALPVQSLHFVPVDYKKDFQLVRLIDDSFDPRLDAKAVKN